MNYNKESLQNDLNWLEGQGVDNIDGKEFIINLITNGFFMTEKQFAKFKKMIEVDFQ